MVHSDTIRHKKVGIYTNSPEKTVKFLKSNMKFYIV